MPWLPVSEYDFDASQNSVFETSDDILWFDWVDLIWGAVTVGRHGLEDVLHFGTASGFDIFWRAAVVRSSLAIGGPGKNSNRFVPNPAFVAMDASEKAVVTYVLGMSLAKLTAEERCQVPWLMHLGVYAGTSPYPMSLHAVYEPGRSRPDLVGRTLDGRWAVFEAKGRTATPTEDVLVRAKNQTRQLSTINQSTPSWRLAAVASLGGSHLSLDLVDPTDAAPEAVALELNEDAFVADYYSAFVRLLRDGSVGFLPNGKRYRATQLSSLDASVGLQADVFDAIAESETLDGLSKTIAELLGHSTPRARSIEARPEPTYDRVGSDGIIVSLEPSWRD